MGNVYRHKGRYLRCNICAGMKRRDPKLYNKREDFTKLDRMANYIKFYSPTKEELMVEFGVTRSTLDKYIHRLYKHHNLVSETRYKITM